MKKYSLTPNNCAFKVPGGSSAESHAIVAQLAMMTVRMNGSKYGFSTK